MYVSLFRTIASCDVSICIGPNISLIVGSIRGYIEANGLILGHESIDQTLRYLGMQFKNARKGMKRLSEVKRRIGKMHLEGGSW